MNVIRLVSPFALIFGGMLAAQTGNNGPMLTPFIPDHSDARVDAAQVELEADNASRLTNPETAQYLHELETVLMTSSEADTNDDESILSEKLLNQSDLIARDLAFTANEQDLLTDGEAEFDGLEEVLQQEARAIEARIALLENQLQSIHEELPDEAGVIARLDSLLEEEDNGDQEAVQWLVQAELGKIR